MNIKQCVGLVAVAALGAAGCGGDGDSDDTTAKAGGDTTTSASTATAASGSTSPTASTAASTTTPVTAPGGSESGETVFEDPFDDDRNGWGVFDDPQFGSTRYEGGDYVWDFRGSVAHLLPAVLGDQYDRGELDMLSVVVRAEVTIVEGGGVVGVFCRETPDEDAEWQWYEFVTRDGYAAIRQADSEGNLDTLAETDSVSLPAGEPIVIEATCVDDSSGAAQLAMTLNGRPALQAVDSEPLGNGVAGVQGWTYPVHEPMAVRWHDFSVRRPEG